MPGPVACTLANPEGGDRLLDVGSSLCTQCGLCCTGALHNYAVLEPDEVPFAHTLGLTVRTEGRPGFSLPCPRLVNSICSIYESRPMVCARYRCQLLIDVEAGETEFESAIDKVETAKLLVAQVDAVIPMGVTLPQARERMRIEPSPEAASFVRIEDMRLKLAITALSVYLDKYFRNSKEGKILSLEPITDDQANSEMR